MFGWKKRFREQKFNEWLYLDGMAVTTAIMIDRAERQQEAINVAVGMKYAMEKFAERCGGLEQLYKLYQTYPHIKELSLREE